MIVYWLTHDLHSWWSNKLQLVFPISGLLLSCFICQASGKTIQEQATIEVSNVTTTQDLNKPTFINQHQTTVYDYGCFKIMAYMQREVCTSQQTRWQQTMTRLLRMCKCISTFGCHDPVEWHWQETANALPALATWYHHRHVLLHPATPLGWWRGRAKSSEISWHPRNSVQAELMHGVTSSPGDKAWTYWGGRIQALSDMFGQSNLGPCGNLPLRPSWYIGINHLSFRAVILPWVALLHLFIALLTCIVFRTEMCAWTG